MTDIKKYNYFSILLPTNYINSHFKCFGHFTTDHLFYLFKFKHFLKKEYEINIKSINIICKQEYLRKFMLEFYNLLFDEVLINSSKNSNNSMNLGIVLGSLEGTEKKRIYLAKNKFKNKYIPNELYENSRKISDNNKLYIKLFRNYLLKRVNMQEGNNQKIDFLIINRKNNGRRWINMNLLVNELSKKGVKYEIKNMEEYNLREQILIVNNSKTILFPSGSSQAHLLWVNPKSTCIECFIPGHRYINSISYAINLGVNLITLFSKLNIDISKFNINNNIKKLIKYNNEASQELYSKNITEKKINSEISWFEIFLLPECEKYYFRQCVEDLDIKLYLNKIINHL